MPTMPSQAVSLLSTAKPFEKKNTFEACISMETTFVYASRHLELSSSWRTYRIGSTSPSEWIFRSLKILCNIYRCHIPALQKKMSPAKSHKPCATASTLGGRIVASLSPVKCRYQRFMAHNQLPEEDVRFGDKGGPHFSTMPALSLRIFVVDHIEVKFGSSQISKCLTSATRNLPVLLGGFPICSLFLHHLQSPSINSSMSS